MARRTRLFVSAGAVVWTALAGCSGSRQAGTAAAPEPAIEATTFASSLGIDLPKFTRTRSGAYYFDVLAGAGATATTGRQIRVRYAIYLPSGAEVQVQTTPVDLTLGNDLIRGWREALPGMRVGGVRKMIIPPALAYGRTAHGNIPPNSTLVFDIELLSVW